jgi:hypothetical protein
MKIAVENVLNVTKKELDESIAAECGVKRNQL